ncbi:class I SAM-dependent methyltransferase, partial [Roseomonas sp. SSH11]
MALSPVHASAPALSYLNERLQEAQPCNSRFEVFDRALQSIPDHGLICEFGVFKAESINYIADQLPDRALFGFDSFEGLPEHWRKEFGPGAFSVEGVLPEVRQNVRLIKGWFDATLPDFAAKHDGPVALLHIDCDLYSSTRCVLDHLGSRLMAGSILIFDEFFNYPGWEEHEFRAFAEFAEQRKLPHEYLAYNATHEQVAIR